MNKMEKQLLVGFFTFLAISFISTLFLFMKMDEIQEKDKIIENYRKDLTECIEDSKKKDPSIRYNITSIPVDRMGIKVVEIWPNNPDCIRSIDASYCPVCKCGEKE